MADNEQIGGVSIGITGDYSSLAADFAQAQQLAQRAGQGIASALDVAMARADGLSTSVEGAATSMGMLGSAASNAGSGVETADQFIKELNSDIEKLFGADKAVSAIGDGAAKSAPELENLGSDLNEVEKAAQRVGEEWGRDQEKIDSAIKGSRQEFRAFTGDLKTGEAQLRQLGQSIQNGFSNPLQFASNSLKNFAVEIGTVGVVALGVAAGIAAVGYEAFNLVKEAGAAAEATGNLADRLNLTWHQTRELEEMGQIAGVSINGLQMASFRLAEALEDASGSGKKVADALDKLGVAGNTSGELLSGLLEKLAQIPDATERIAKAHDIMGRASQQIIPLIKNYGELQAAVRSLGGSIDDDMAAKLQHADDELDKLSIAWKHLKEAFAEKLTPVIEFVVKQATDTVSGNEHGMNPGLVMAGGSGTEAMRKLHDAQMELQAQAERDKAAVDATFGAYMRDVGTFEADAAHAWSEAHSKTLAGMKQALTDTTKEIATLAGLLSRSDPNRDADQAKYNAALAKQAQLQQAIADASVKDSDIKQKAIKFQTAGAEVLSILLADAANKYRQVAQEIAGVILVWQRLTGQVLTPWQVLQRDSEAAARSIADLKEHALDSAPALETIADAAMDVGKSIDKIISSSAEVAGSSAFKQLTEDGQRFGETSTFEFAKIAADSQAAFQRMQDSGLFTYDALARAAIKTRIAILDSQRATGQLSADEYRQAIDDQKALLDDLAGKSAATSEKMGKGMQNFLHQTESAIKSVSSAITDLIVDGGKFGDAFAKVGKTIVKILVTDIVEYGFGKLLMALFSADSALYNLGKGLAGVFGSATAKAAPGAVASSTAPIVANTAATTANTVSTSANTAGDVANTTATATDTIATVADAAATAVNAGATIADAIATAANTGAIAASTVESVASRVIWSTSETANTVATTANSGVVAANTAALAALTTALAASTGASAASGAAGAAGGAGGAFGGAGGLLSGIGSIAQVGTFISSVVGNLQNAKQETTLNAIEHNTRFTMMYLGERADGGILGELFKINNEIAWGFNTKATEAILSLLESAHLTSGGGGSSGALVSITNSTFNGGASQADADRIGQAIVTQLQRAGAIRQ